MHCNAVNICIFNQESELKQLSKTCVDIATADPKVKNGYFTLHDATSKPYLAYCDFHSDPGFAWTLVESLSLPNARSSTFRKSFYYNIPSNECTPNWSHYRLSKVRMTSLKNSPSSSHFRATCNFNSQDPKGLQNRRDYLRVSFCAYNFFLQARNVHTCTTVDYINIRGHSCSKCSIPLYSSNSYHLFIHLPQAKAACSRYTVPNMVSTEDGFGHYHRINAQFSCTANSTATTNWWIGGAVF